MKGLKTHMKIEWRYIQSSNEMLFYARTQEKPRPRKTQDCANAQDQQNIISHIYKYMCAYMACACARVQQTTVHTYIQDKAPSICIYKSVNCCPHKK